MKSIVCDAKSKTKITRFRHVTFRFRHVTFIFYIILDILDDVWKFLFYF